MGSYLARGVSLLKQYINLYAPSTLKIQFTCVGWPYNTRFLTSSTAELSATTDDRTATAIELPTAIRRGGRVKAWHDHHTSSYLVRLQRIKRRVDVLEGNDRNIGANDSLGILNFVSTAAQGGLQ